jgi:uncharacterized protein (TIGR03435 family)
MFIGPQFIWIVMMAGIALAQTFEAASVRRAPPDDGLGMNHVAEDAAQVSYRNVTLGNLLARAYPEDYRIYGPEWIETERYDVVAKIPEGTALRQLPAMLRNLIDERFRLQAHTDQREYPGYHLVVAKGGPKLGAAPEDADFPHLDGPGLTTAHTISQGAAVVRMTARAQPIARLAVVIGTLLRIPVEDKTGLTDVYDFRLEFAETGSGPDQDGPPAIDLAIKHLGLALERTKVTRKVLVVDHAEKAPAAN